MLRGAVESKVCGDLAEHRAQGEPVAAEAGDDDQAVLPGQVIDHRKTVRRHVDEAGPIPLSDGITGGGEDLGEQVQRVVDRAPVDHRFG